MGAAADPIEVVPYDPTWPSRFASETVALTPLLAACGLVAVEHIGSTAIVGAGAKPIIDIMAGVRVLADAEAAIAPLAAAGYRHWVDDPTRQERLYFVRGLPPDAPRRTHHLHVVEHDGAWWRRHVLFRDRLRASPMLVAEYVALKRTLAARFREDREAYTDGKAEFVARVLRSPG